MFVATLQCLNYRGQESKTPISLQFSDIPVTLKQSQGHQPQNNKVVGYNHEKFERSCFNSVRERKKKKKKVIFLFKQGNVNYLPRA